MAVQEILIVSVRQSYQAFDNLVSLVLYWDTGISCHLGGQDEYKI